MILFIMAIIAGCLAVSYTRANTDTLILEPFRIKAAATGEAQWALHHSFHQTKLQYKGNNIAAYYRSPESLVGFGKTLSTIDLPADVAKKINSRFHECAILNVMLFIDSKGHIYYYAGIVQSNKLIALKVSSRCRMNILQKISLN
ncbi:MAG: hypothetical protein ABI861_08165 [Panacibacter sp.]